MGHSHGTVRNHLKSTRKGNFAKRTFYSYFTFFCTDSLYADRAHFTVFGAESAQRKIVVSLWLVMTSVEFITAASFWSVTLSLAYSCTSQYAFVVVRSLRKS